MDLGKRFIMTFLVLILSLSTTAIAVEKSKQILAATKLHWHSDYATAYRDAAKQKKMLFIYFYNSKKDAAVKKYETDVLSNHEIQKQLKQYVLVKLPTDHQYFDGKQKKVLLKHDAFGYMYGRQGISIVDLKNSKKDFYGSVVNCFAFNKKFQYNVSQTKVILNLPPGSITQRTMVYAVRIHHESPQSTNGKHNAMLFAESSSHSQHQANINLQGHHNWESRFHQISNKLGNGMLATEVCAESWPGEELVEAAVECVYCWRQSSGHWSAVSRYHPVFGYGMRRGSNGIWYATGIFGHR